MTVEHGYATIVTVVGGVTVVAAGFVVVRGIVIEELGSTETLLLPGSLELLGLGESDAVAVGVAVAELL